MKINVAARVMTEDKASEVMNLVAHPQAKVNIVEAAGPILPRALALHYFDQISEVDTDTRAIDGYDVAWFDPAIMILVKRQERFVDRRKISCDLGADKQVELLDSFLNCRSQLFHLCGILWLLSAFLLLWVLTC